MKYWSVCVLLFVGLPLARSEDFVPRHYYQAKLEPVAHVLHGAGQCDAQDVEDYRKALQSYDPAIFMDYCGARGTGKGFTDGLKKKLGVFPKYTTVQLGLCMTNDGKPDGHYEHDVAAGKHDAELIEMLQGLKALDVPIYIRIGYECNGYWNGYKPEEYKKAFQHVTKLIREQKVNAATVWCTVPLGKIEDVMKYYPGDEWVDWWAVDIFRSPDIAKSKQIIEEAHKRGKPMMIGESTPHSVGVLDGQASWNKWFDPYFKLIRTSPGIKAFCYINWNWAKYLQWKNWGDARLQENSVVLDLYRKEMSLPLYQHASTQKTFEDSLSAKVNPMTPNKPDAGVGPPPGTEWTPIPELTDEFDGDKLDQAKWHDHNPGWLGREPGYFSKNNVAVSDGKLHLTARVETLPDLPKGFHTFTTAAVKSKALVKYGYFEIKCRPMKSKASSAFWFYQETKQEWTEIDVFEICGAGDKFKNKVFMSVHVFRTPTEKKHWQKTKEWKAPFNLVDDYRVYALEWNKDVIKWWVDGKVVHELKNTHWHQPLHMNFDSETFPDWFGLPDKETLPSTFSIEYVRSWTATPTPKNPDSGPSK